MRRDRMTRRVEQRQQWAQSARRKADTASNAAREIMDRIPLGQPILIGHHSERRHRRDIGRIDGNMRRASELSDLADEHERKAAGLAAQLERNIYSDDPDAPEALAARIAELEAERDRRRAANAAYRKGGAAALAGDAQALADLATMRAIYPGMDLAPYQPSSMANLGANIRRLKGRIQQVQALQAKRDAAADSPDGVLIRGGDTYISVTFAEKPPRAVLQALKAAGFHWRQGSWHGFRADLPDGIAD